MDHKHGGLPGMQMRQQNACLGVPFGAGLSANGTFVHRHEEGTEVSYSVTCRRSEGQLGASALDCGQSLGRKLV